MVKYLNVQESTGGNVRGLIPNSYPYPDGAAVTVVAQALPGYQFAGWVQNGGAPGGTSPLVVTLSTDQRLYPTFTQIEGESTGPSNVVQGTHCPYCFNGCAICGYRVVVP